MDFLPLKRRVLVSCVVASEALREGPPFHGSRNQREIETQSASCQIGGREVTGRYNRFLLQENERSRSYKMTNLYPKLYDGFLDPSASPEQG